MTASLSVDVAIAAAGATLFPGFHSFRQMANGAEIAGMIGGSEPPLLLLHGHPQSHMIWHRVVHELVHDYMVVATDLCGYGASSKPAGGTRHAKCSERTMAQDQMGMMRTLGFGRFRLCVHDRGACVAHRLCIDRPLHAECTMLFDIVPALAVYEHTDMALASAYWHQFFLIQPSPFPEALINAMPDFYIGELMSLRHVGFEPFAPEATVTCTVTMRGPACVHTMCKDYRAVTTTDLEHDHAGYDAGKRMGASLRVLRDEYDAVQRCFKPLGL